MNRVKLGFFDLFFDVSNSSNHRKIKSKSSITTKIIIIISKSSNHKKYYQKVLTTKKLFKFFLTSMGYPMMALYD